MSMPNTHDLDLSARAAQILSSRASVGLALGVVGPDGLEQLHTHGVADVTTREPISAATVFRVASITKTFTAVAVMQLWEKGLVDLDGPASDHLRAYTIVPGEPDWRPATLRHLLTHTAGIGEEVPRTAALRRDFGESVPRGRPVPSLAEHYGGRLRLDTEPGTRFRYTDHGPATLGQIVEDVTGMPFAQYLREHVFAPLGMVDTDLDRSETFLPRLATGYTLGSRGASAVRDRAWITAGASSACSTPRDMARYAAALLGGGSNEHGSVLQPSTVAAMFAPGYLPDPRLPGIGLAFFRGSVGGQPIVDHQGILPGFDSQITLAPEDGVGVIAFSNGTRLGSLWMPSEAGRILATLLDVPEDGIRDDVPHRPETWADICGWYYLPGPVTDLRARLSVGAGVEVRVRRGRLVLRGLTPIPLLAKGFPLHPDDPDDPYLFRIDLSEYDLGSLRVAFSQDGSGHVDAVHLDVMPLSAYKRAEASNPRRWAEGVAALGATAVIGRRLRRTLVG